MAPSTPRPTGGPKIIIKARRSRLAALTSAESPATEDVHTSDADVDVESGTPSLAAATPREEEEEEEEGDVEPEGDSDGDGARDGEDGEQGGGDVEASREGTPARRGRGRPRGRPKGSGSGASTPRPKGSGRGRGRGRPRGITIKLPRRSAEDGHEEGAEVVPEGEEGPVGGGKPFRRIQGKAYIIEGDEYVTEDDPKGDTKIDANGNLLGGRRFKAQTFTLPNRHPERQYMLAIDAARTSGFRDSLYYFRRNLLAMKLNATQWEKEHLIEAGKLGSHLRTRSVTLVTARSAYKLHGAKMLIEGRWVVDDYYEDKALEDTLAKGLTPGDLVGELQDISTIAAEAAALAGGAVQAAAKQERSGGGPGIYRAGGPTTIFGGSGWGPYSDGPLNAVRKSMLNRDGLNEENWLLVAAQRTVEAGEEWAQLRREALKACGGILGDVGRTDRVDVVGETRPGEELTRDGAKRRKLWDEGDLPMGVYEPQTGIVLYRADTQPTRSRWEQLPDDREKRRVLGGAKAGSAAWAIAWVDTVMEISTEEERDREGAKARAPLMPLARTASS